MSVILAAVWPSVGVGVKDGAGVIGIRLKPWRRPIEAVTIDMLRLAGREHDPAAVEMLAIAAEALRGAIGV
jgi:hypothetical protein